MKNRLICYLKQLVKQSFRVLMLSKSINKMNNKKKIELNKWSEWKWDRTVDSMSSFRPKVKKATLVDEMAEKLIVSSESLTFLIFSSDPLSIERSADKFSADRSRVWKRFRLRIFFVTAFRESLSRKKKKKNVHRIRERRHGSGRL